MHDEQPYTDPSESSHNHDGRKCLIIIIIIVVASGGVGYFIGVNKTCPSVDTTPCFIENDGDSLYFNVTLESKRIEFGGDTSSPKYFVNNGTMDFLCTQSIYYTIPLNISIMIRLEPNKLAISNTLAIAQFLIL